MFPVCQWRRNFPRHIGGQNLFQQNWNMLIIKGNWEKNLFIYYKRDNYYIVVEVKFAWCIYAYLQENFLGYVISSPGGSDLLFFTIVKLKLHLVAKSWTYPPILTIKWTVWLLSFFLFFIWAYQVWSINGVCDKFSLLYSCICVNFVIVFIVVFHHVNESQIFFLHNK